MGENIWTERSITSHFIFEQMILIYECLELVTIPLCTLAIRYEEEQKMVSVQDV